MKLTLSLLMSLFLVVSFVMAEVPTTEQFKCPMKEYGKAAIGGFHGGWGVGMLFAGILYLAILALIIAATYWLIQSARKKK